MRNKNFNPNITKSFYLTRHNLFKNIAENAKYLKGKFVNVYVPTTPNPTSGYTLNVPTKKIIEIDLSVDQVLKYVISMGVSTTDKEFIKNNKKKRK